MSDVPIKSDASGTSNNANSPNRSNTPNTAKIRAAVRIRKITRMWSLVLIVLALLAAAGYILNWIHTGTADPHAVEQYPPIENLPPILEFLAVTGLAVALRRERIGGLITAVSSVAVLPILLIHWPLTARNFPHYIIAPYGLWLLILIPGILFLLCRRLDTKRLGK